MSNIIALVYISLSELQTVDPKYTEDWVDNNPDDVVKVLRSLGLETNLPYERQFCTHRNRFGNINTTSRFVGNEMTNQEWIDSPYSSQEAKDRVLNNKLVNNLYQMRGMTE